MCVHIHNAFASNELISVTILLLYTDSLFRLSLLIFLSWRKRTFSKTIMTLSVSILHIPFLFCIAYLAFFFTYTRCLHIKFHSLPYWLFKVAAFPEHCTISVTFHRIIRGMFLEPFQRFVTTMVLSDDNQFPCDLNPLPFQESGLFSLKKQALKIKYVSK